MKPKRELDFSAFPPGTVTEYTTLVCLACIFDIFTKQFGLAPRSAYSEIKRYFTNNQGINVTEGCASRSLIARRNIPAVRTAILPNVGTRALIHRQSKVAKHQTLLAAHL
jgi:hypothetical protein